MELIDTHCHLTSLEHAPLEQIFSNAAKADVTRYITIGASEGLDSATQAVKLAEANSAVWASIGVHPHDAGDFVSIEPLEHLAASSRVVAIGETGLDYFRNLAPRDRQFELFENSIFFAKKFHKPLIIHSREAASDCLEVLTRLKAEEVGGVFHCYSEDYEFSKKLRAINFVVSFPGSLTFKSAHQLRETAKNIPLEQIMLETDAPYMAPEPFRGKPSEPMHVYQVARKLAEIKNIPLEEVARVTSDTACKLFGIDTTPSLASQKDDRK